MKSIKCIRKTMLSVLLIGFSISTVSSKIMIQTVNAETAKPKRSNSVPTAYNYIQLDIEERKEAAFAYLSAMKTEESDPEEIADEVTEEVKETQELEETTVDTPEPQTVPNTPEYASNGICGKDGYVDDIWVSKVNQKLEAVPQSLLDAFQKDGWQICVTDKNIDAVYFQSKYGAVMGTTNYFEHRILIEPRQDAINEAVIHEFGHWFDWHLGTVTDSDEFMSIYNNETTAFQNTFNVNFYYDKKELFAEAFWKYLTNGAALQNSCPYLYEFINRYI